MVALAGVGGGFHFAQQGVHFGDAEDAPGAHGAVAGHGRADLFEALLEGQGVVEFGEIVGVPVTVSPGTGWQPIYFSGRIAWIEVDNLDTQEMNAIDDFGFTPLPEPGAALTLVSGFGMLLAMAKLRAIPVLH